MCPGPKIKNKTKSSFFFSLFVVLYAPEQNFLAKNEIKQNLLFSSLSRLAEII